MKYLYLLAHPDDEVVASGGTIRKLVNNGDQVRVVLATKGQAGKGANKRIEEFKKSCEILGVSDYKLLGYQDGEINNKLVWGRLEQDFIDEINSYKPEAVVTFDHSGWYFHLDHVGVSLAGVRGVDKAQHKVEVVLFSLFQPPGIKSRWKYVYADKLPVTHRVDIEDVLEVKMKAVMAHKSQKITFLPYLALGKLHKKYFDHEYFQVALASKRGRKMLEGSDIFREI